jgi:hypothetical protein
MQRRTAQRTGFDKLIMSADVLGVSEDAGSAVPAVTVEYRLPPRCAIPETPCRR